MQFLANRGYAVLQVNFRGSTGYGRRHITAAIGEFAGQDARRPHRRRRLGRRAGLCRPGPHRHLRRLLRRLRRARRRHRHPGPLRRRRRLRRHLRPGQLHGHPAGVRAREHDQQLDRLRRRPRRPRAARRHAAPLPDHHGRPDPYPAAGRPGRQRRPRRAGRVRQHRRRRCANAGSPSSTSSPTTRATASRTRRTRSCCSARSNGTSPRTSAAATQPPPDRRPRRRHGGDRAGRAGPGQARYDDTTLAAVRERKPPAATKTTTGTAEWTKPHGPPMWWSSVGCRPVTDAGSTAPRRSSRGPVGHIHSSSPVDRAVRTRTASVGDEAELDGQHDLVPAPLRARPHRSSAFDASPRTRHLHVPQRHIAGWPSSDNGSGAATARSSPAVGVPPCNRRDDTVGTTGFEPATP